MQRCATQCANEENATKTTEEWQKYRNALDAFVVISIFPAALMRMPANWSKVIFIVLASHAKELISALFFICLRSKFFKLVKKKRKTVPHWIRTNSLRQFAAVHIFDVWPALRDSYRLKLTNLTHGRHFGAVFQFDSFSLCAVNGGWRR